jgi:hypothetical protein
MSLAPPKSLSKTLNEERKEEECGTHSLVACPPVSPKTQTHTDAPESAGERKRKEEACVLFAVFYIRMVVEKR